MARKTPVDLLIFDLDGTLIESKWDIAHSVNLTLEELGLSRRPQEEIFGFVGDGVKRLLRLAVGEENQAKYIEYTKVILDGLGNHHFAYIIGGDDGYGLKPEPGMLLKIMEALRVPRERTVLIGDSTNDINGGHNAGIRVCAVGYGMGNREKMVACRPDWFIERPEELMEIFL